MYVPSEKSVWSGRVDDIEDKSSFRYHQAVKIQNLEEVTISKEKQIAIISFDCDEGVRRNKGRLGAAKGSYAIKKAMANLPWNKQKINDVGVIVCEESKLEEAQEELGEAIAKLVKSNMKTIVLGGGHETLYGNYLGVRKAIGKDKRIGIINIDAHFDLRKFDDQPSSGTMFNQILTEDEQAFYLVLGIQRFGNTEALYKRAHQLEVEYICEDELLEMSKSEIQEKIDQFANNCDVLLLTLCMDVIAIDSAPGVSAPSVFGLQPTFVRKLIHMVLKQSNLLSFDICEVNPLLDIDGRTAKLAGAFVNEVIVYLN